MFTKTNLTPKFVLQKKPNFMPIPNSLNLACNVYVSNVPASVAVPDPNPDLHPPDPHVFGPLGSGSGSFYHHAKIVRKTLIPTIL